MAKKSLTSPTIHKSIRSTYPHEPDALRRLLNNTAFVGILSKLDISVTNWETSALD